MWKGWISLLTAGWFFISGAISELQTVTSLMVIGVLLIIVGIVKIKSWHDLALIAYGIWLIFSAAFLSWASAPVFFVSAVVVLYLGIMYVKLNAPELTNNNA